MRFLFRLAVHRIALHEHVEIHEVRVELRAVDAGELAFAVHQHATAAAHPRAVNHDRVQAYDGADCSFRVMSATALIIGIGPTARTRSMRVPLSHQLREACP